MEIWIKNEYQGFRFRYMNINFDLPVLIEHFDIDLAVIVFSQNFLSIILSVERVHEDEWDVDVVSFVQMLDLLNGQIEKVEARSNRNKGLGSGTTH